jgi:hypothetical protein
VAWRAFSDVRFGTRYPGMGWNFFRTGPLWTLAPWLVVGTQGTVIAVQAEPGRFLQEYRAELEPTLLWRWGDVSFSDRNRLEYRMRFGAASTAHFRYRNQLRAAWAPTGSRWQPFVWNEPMIELNGEGLAQNRAEAGIGYVFSPDARVDVGLMMRSRAGQGPWEHDVIINTYLFYAPQVRPVLDGP